ncbi:UBA2, partial [Symbiodinium necroappetens]
MTKMKALVVGCTGVAAEIVKNLVLQGLGAVTLVDKKPVQIQDLGTNFFLSEADVGKPLAATLVPKFQELNPFCSIRTETSLTPEVVRQHSVLLVCESMPLPDLLKWNDFCRTNQPKPVAFIYVRTGGVFGNVFVDFGPQHVLMDANGQVAFVAGAAPTRVSPLAAPGAAAALRGRRARRAARLERKAFGKFLGNIKFPWDNDNKEESSSAPKNGKPSTTWKELLLLKDLGASSFDKALQVNLDNTIYGSFAEIGAGQE